MDYELALKLKNAGFPHTWCSEDDCSCLINGNDTDCFPTLSELIEACGDRFDALIKDSEVKGDWVATAENGDADNLVSITCSTPEEAVANLWIELNKK